MLAVDTNHPIAGNIRERKWYYQSRSVWTVLQFKYYNVCSLLTPSKSARHNMYKLAS